MQQPQILVRILAISRFRVKGLRNWAFQGLPEGNVCTGVSCVRSRS